MAIETISHDYEIDGKTYEAFIAHHGSPKPGILISHAWGGRTDGENKKAEMIAALGYTAIAIDLYGKGVVGQSTEENQALMTPLVSDRPLLQKLLHHNIDMIKGLPQVDETKIAAVGYCFGGLCVLDIARSNGAVSGVVSLHGLLSAPGNTTEQIDAKVLVLHGWDDPMVPPSEVEAFGKEMTTAKADWQLHAYGGAMHAFTNPAANDPDFGTVYHPDADRRAEIATANFLDELFA